MLRGFTFDEEFGLWYSDKGREYAYEVIPLEWNKKRAAGRQLILECPKCRGRNFVRAIYENGENDMDRLGFRCTSCETVLPYSALNCRFDDLQDPWINRHGKVLDKDDYEGCKD
jgi:ribosomal protein L33